MLKVAMPSKYHVLNDENHLKVIQKQAFCRPDVQIWFLMKLTLLFIVQFIWLFF